MPSMKTDSNPNSLAKAPVWKTIRLGTHKSPDALHRAMKAANGSCYEEAAVHMLFNNTPLSKTPYRLRLIKVSVGELGFGEKGATYQEICDRGIELGLALCPAEVGPQLRRQYRNSQPHDEWLHIAMNPPVNAKSDTVPHYSVHRNHQWGVNSGKLFLRLYFAGRTQRLQTFRLFVFAQKI